MLAKFSQSLNDTILLILTTLVIKWTFIKNIVTSQGLKKIFINGDLADVG